MSINFESTRQKAVEREKLREARSLVLEKAKIQHERKEKAKEVAKLKGEGTWMLPALSNRIDQENRELDKAKKKKKKKEKKKKDKKKKKKRRNKESSGDDSSSSDTDQNGDDEPMWVEKTKPVQKKEEQAEASAAIRGPRLERDSWMTEAPGFFPCTSRADIREQKRKESEQEVALMDQMGQHERELNPYWKDGGTGLPEEEKKKEKPSSMAGDGGVSWLRKAYQRCVERAKEEGKSLEDVASEQYGSLDKLQSMIAEAEEKAGLHRSRNNDRNRRNDDRRRSRSRDRNRSRDREYRRERHRSRSRDRYRSRKDDSRERDSQKPRHRSRSRSRDRHRGRSRSRERSRYDRDGDRTSTLGSKLKGRFMKPGEMDSSSSGSRSRRSPERSSSWRKKGFMKPGEIEVSLPRRDSPPRRSRHRRSSSSSSTDSEEENPRKKFPFRKPTNDSDDDRKTYERKPQGPPRWKKPGSSTAQLPEKTKQRRDSSVESGSSESGSSESEFESSNSEPEKTQEEPAVVVLTEDEMNKLGAKLMKAELMGNTALAERLKAQLASVRKAKEDAGIKTTAAAERKQLIEEKEENVVVLTRTDRAGNVRPLVDMGESSSGGKGKKRKKNKNIQTHATKGERERYFDDDDKYDLKAMVAREKLSTAEDANAMFARLAGRGLERTDDDHQVDDVFLSRAAGMQSETKINDREKLASVMESRKIQSAIETCRFCFDNVPKHLIVAIGIKVYLCLPNHRSMADGHCLIIPMQHVASGTHVDEDVWAEIQIFRKGLTRMFADNEEDVMFMETSINLRRHPHMVVEVIPIAKEIGDMAPIYFKKAIMDTGSEWAQNKKVVDLSQKDVRKAVPKGFPYFAVDFGLQGGFAHVVEEEKDFPSYFGREICGGMMELGPELWRKPHKENFDAQREKVLKFAQMWKPYDWTQKLKAQKEDSD